MGSVIAVRLVLAIAAVTAVAGLSLALRASHLERQGEAAAPSTKTRLDDPDTARALVRFRKAQRFNPDTTPELREAGLYLLAGQPRRALPILEDIVRREPDNANAWNLIAFGAQDLDPPRAAEARRRFKELSPPVARE